MKNKFDKNMNTKKLKLALLNINNKNNEKTNKGNKFLKYTSNRNNKLINNASFNNSSINASNFVPNKRLLHFSLSQNKYTNLNLDDIQKINENSDILRDNLIKTKEKYNEKSSELYNLKLKYNKLNQYNRDNLKLLYNIMNRAGITPNKEEIDNNNNNNLDISQILSKEENKTLSFYYSLYNLKHI